MSENITIRLRKITRQGLREIGTKGQTYDQIVSAMIEKEKSK